jgi:Ni,Fe-hydrogenase maturation factor
MKVLVFGNPFLENDSLPLKILPKLAEKFPGIEFKEIDPTEDLENQGRNLTILDTVEGIEKVMEINSIEQLHTNKVYTMHDFDLAYNLKLLKKIGKIDSVRIIGVPMLISEEDAMDQIQSTFKKWAAQDMQGS